LRGVIEGLVKLLLLTTCLRPPLESLRPPGAMLDDRVKSWRAAAGRGQRVGAIDPIDSSLSLFL
jgi:hypothetical protein